MNYASIIVGLLNLCLLSNCNIETTASQETTEETTTVQENQWVSLFNGKDLTGWTVKINGHAAGENYKNTFRVEDGILKVSYVDYDKFGRSFGHIFYNTPYSNYKIRLQYRFVGEQVEKIGDWAIKNSGVMLHSQSAESMGVGQEFPVSLEAQLLGGYEEGIDRPTGNLCSPGVHVIMGDTLTTEHCLYSSSPTFYGEEWVDFEALILNDSLIVHSINGKEVIRYSKPVYGGEYSVDTPEWAGTEGKALKTGYISLQSESHPIEFRKIELRELD